MIIGFEEDPKQRSIFRDVHLLLNEEVTIDGIRFWGSPVTPLYSGAFGLSNPADRVRHWALIPEGTDVVITHGPPAGILDQRLNMIQGCGDPELLGAVRRVSPKLHVFGHVHGVYGQRTVNEATFINAALLGEDRLEYEPVILDF